MLSGSITALVTPFKKDGAFDEANFINDEDEEIDAFHEFAERMAKLSPECLDIASPYLN